MITARHCKYLAFGLVMGDPCALVYAADQALQVSSGVSVLPEREYSSMRPPAGTIAFQLIDPQVEII